MENTGVAGRTWFKSSFSKDANSCVEVLFADEVVRVRDSKYDGSPAEQPVITVPADAWNEFLAAATERTELSIRSGAPTIEFDSTGNTIMYGADGTKLVYTPREWDCFVAGIRADEFSPAAVN